MPIARSSTRYLPRHIFKGPRNATQAINPDNCSCVGPCGFRRSSQPDSRGTRELPGYWLQISQYHFDRSKPWQHVDETGAVGLNGGSQFVTGDAKTGNSQTQIRSFTDLLVTSAASLRLVFNAVEPGGTDNSINLDAVTLTVYNAAGTSILFTASLDRPYAFANTFVGAGNSGFVFTLTSAEAAELQAVFAPSDRIGLSASAPNATAGPETFLSRTRWRRLRRYRNLINTRRSWPGWALSASWRAGTRPEPRVPKTMVPPNRGLLAPINAAEIHSG